MKVIDLLNKIANGEEDRLKYHKFSQNDEFLCRYIIDEENLNLEIIEDTPKEDKKIKKFYFSIYQDERLGGREVVEPLETKINEIIDNINEISNKINGE